MGHPQTLAPTGKSVPLLDGEPPHASKHHGASRITGSPCELLSQSTVAATSQNPESSQLLTGVGWGGTEALCVIGSLDGNGSR